MQIVGTVRTYQPTRRSAIATVHVRFLDVSRIDTASVRIAEVIVEDIKVTGGTPLVVPFTLQVNESRLDPLGSYELAAHVDLTGSGTITAGDYVTTSSIPISDQQPTGFVEVPVWEVF